MAGSTCLSKSIRCYKNVLNLLLQSHFSEVTDLPGAIEEKAAYPPLFLYPFPGSLLSLRTEAAYTSRVMHALHVFPRLAEVKCFLVLDTD